MSYEYTDFDGDRLIIENTDWPARTASVSVHGNAVFVPAAEAPKAAQAILDAAGVKGAVLTDLPEVTFDGKYYNFGGGISWSSDFDVAFLKTKALRWTAAWKAAAKREAKAESEDAELKALEDLKAKIEAQKAHDDLRTSPIAMKALALYNRGIFGTEPYKTWDATNLGKGSPDNVVHAYIRRADQTEAKEKEAAEKLAARRDELVRNHALGLDAYCYDDLDVNGKYLVDRLRIALDEGKDAKDVKAA